MIVQIFLFAAAKDIVGTSKLELTLDDESTVGDLRKKLLEKYPSMKSLMVQSAISVGQQYVPDEELLFHGADVGLIPPVSGG